MQSQAAVEAVVNFNASGNFLRSVDSIEQVLDDAVWTPALLWIDRIDGLIPLAEGNARLPRSEQNRLMVWDVLLDVVGRWGGVRTRQQDRLEEFIVYNDARQISCRKEIIDDFQIVNDRRPILVAEGVQVIGVRVGDNIERGLLIHIQLCA